MCAAAAAAAVQSWLDSLGHHASLDKEIMEYVCSVLEDPDPESSLELLCGVLSECVSSFAARNSEEQAALVLQLLDDAKPGHEASTSTEPTAGIDSSVQAVVAALRQAKLQCQELPEACSDITNTRGAASSTARSSDTSSKHDLAPLLELCPTGISTHFLQHCLQQQFHGDLQAAANWLLEAEAAQLLHYQQVWEDEVQQLEEQRQAVEQQKRRQKKLIVDKFDLRVVSDSSAAAKKGPWQGPELLQVPKKLLAQDSKLRYRDGKVVSTKGEKIIIEKVGEEWDGGSRGKVYTKGKRGKGFH